MGLKPCPECGKEVSDRAATCPSCGYAIAPPVAAASPVPPQAPPPPSPGKWGFGLVSGGCLAIVAIVIGVPIFIVIMMGVCSGITGDIETTPKAAPDTTAVAFPSE